MCLHYITFPKNTYMLNKEHSMLKCHAQLGIFRCNMINVHVATYENTLLGIQMKQDLIFKYAYSYLYFRPCRQLS